MIRIAGTLWLAFAAALCSPPLTQAAEPGGVALASAALPCPHCKGCPHDEIVYQDVVCHRCVMKPDKKEIKKTVYGCKEVPFCLRKLPPLFSHFKKKDCCDSGCDDCGECDCPRYKKVLLKKEVVCDEICTTKCVIEEYVERVPVRVCRACPHCAQGAPACALPAPHCADVAPPAGPIKHSLSDAPAVPLIPAPPVPPRDL
jgi:hypothetical protein